MFTDIHVGGGWLLHLEIPVNKMFVFVLKIGAKTEKALHNHLIRSVCWQNTNATHRRDSAQQQTNCRKDKYNSQQFLLCLSNHNPMSSGEDRKSKLRINEADT